MKIAADCSHPVHAPANSRAAFLSAWIAGADALRLPVRLTKDGHPVVVEAETTDDATGQSGRIADLTLKELRAMDFGKTFKDGDGAPFAYPARIETFALLLDALPAEAWLLVEIKPEADPKRRDKLVAGVVGAARNRGTADRLLVYSSDPEVLKAARRTLPGLAVAAYAPDAEASAAVDAAAAAEADAVALPAAAVVGADGNLTDAGRKVEGLAAAGRLRLGAVLLSAGGLDAGQHGALKNRPWAWGLTADSLLDAAAAVRPGWLWIEEDWSARAADHDDVNADLWHLGYAKYNPERYCHVYPDNGIHIDIKPFQGPVAYKPTGDEVKDQQERLLERTWESIRDWPFYSGGGVGFAVGIVGDFAAEVDVESVAAQQATTVEMAALNVDPATHRKPWKQKENGDWVPNYPESFRDKHTCFDPHGAPPYVGVEHDEDDGWRINWNLGIDYDSNQYGRPAGDGKLLTGRMRLDRRGNHFAAYYRATGKDGARHWVCVGAVRNDSLNPKVFLRLAGKRWRQENPDKPSEFMPVIPNHFTFRNMTITRFV